MAWPSEAPALSPALSGTIARSRSRYKGNRPNKVSENPQSPPNIPLSQLQHIRQNNPFSFRLEHQSASRQLDEIPDRKQAEHGFLTPLQSSSRREKYDLGSDVSGPTSNPAPASHFRTRSDHRLEPKLIRDDVATGFQKRSSAQAPPTYQHHANVPDDNVASELPVVQTPQLQKRPMPTRPVVSHKKSFTQRITGQGSAHNRSKTREDLKRTISGPIPVKQPQSTDIPAFNVLTPATNPGNHPQRKIEPALDASISAAKTEKPPRKVVEAAFDAPSSTGKARMVLPYTAKPAFDAPVSASNLGLKPAFDAPISAVNAGERRVMVKYNQYTMTLPITPSTTPVDIVRCAASQLSEPIDTNATVLLESFKQLGLERPLRRYEHVRDVLNSWDIDTSNTLVIVPSPTGGVDDDLDLKYVAKTQPSDTSIQIYHSQKPGSWDKKWITLRSDGQVLVVKKDGRETSNICHLSDFDIYVPTGRQLSKRIRPPKKVCFAVKSQQKSSMFMSTVNFVHFFSTNDKALATSWYKAVQGWRSWYLVNVMGEGQKDPPKSGNPPVQTRQQGSGFPKHQSRSSIDIQPQYHSSGNVPVDIGHQASGLAKHHSRFLVDFPPNHVSQGTSSTSSPANGLPIRNRAPPPLSFPKKLTKNATTGATMIRTRDPPIIQTEAQNSDVPRSESQTFLAEGLLGRTYTQRQKVQRERGADKDPESTIQSAVPADNADGLKRTSPQRPQTKPLVDLTTQYQELPHHAKKGRGVAYEQIPAGGLVELTTSPELAIPIPPATAWQRPRDNSEDRAPDLGRTKTLRGHSGHLDASDVGQAFSSPEKGDAFTGGLLAGNGKSQGGAGTGRGLMTGDRQARARMLDVGEENRYAPGSLLERVKEREGSKGPVIDRRKRREVNTPVGEAV